MATCFIYSISMAIPAWHNNAHNFRSKITQKKATEKKSMKKLSSLLAAIGVYLLRFFLSLPFEVFVYRCVFIFEPRQSWIRYRFTQHWQWIDRLIIYKMPSKKNNWLWRAVVHFNAKSFALFVNWMESNLIRYIWLNVKCWKVLRKTWTTFKPI